MKVLSDYKCDFCETVFEAYAEPDSKNVRCTVCLSIGARKLPGIPNFRLYGEGFTNRSHKDSGDWG